MTNTSRAAKDSSVRVHAAVLRGTGHVPQAGEVHGMGIHSLRARAQPFHVISREQPPADVTSVTLDAQLSVDFVNR